MTEYGAFNCRRAFFRSEIFDNITVALTVVLKKARYGHAPFGNRYHIVDIESEKPKLNKTMRFELCRNSTSCNKDNCFDARYSAIKYIVEFLSDSNRFVNVVDETDLENKSLKKLYGLYPAPGEGFWPWMRALVNIFRDLFGQQLEVWYPEVHGVMFRIVEVRDCGQLAELLLEEMMKARWRRQMQGFFRYGKV